MSTKRTCVAIRHDEGYGDNLLEYLNIRLQGSDMIGEKIVTVDAIFKLQEDYAKLRTAMLALVGCEESELEQMVVNLRLLITNNVAPSSDIVPSINAVEALIETRG